MVFASTTVALTLVACRLDDTGSTLAPSTDAASSSGDAVTTTSASSMSSSSGVGGALPTTPSCIDGTRNGDESDVDCGGDACAPCALGATCSWHGDCASLTCASGVCSAFVEPGCPPNPDPANPTCADCILDGAETDVDCGGDACGPCADGASCQADVDCTSGDCAATVCAPAGSPTCDVVNPENPTCNDCVLNGGETDVDCGGDACGPCGATSLCATDADCASGACSLFLCQ
jgi:hypothetical protein